MSIRALVVAIVAVAVTVTAGPNGDLRILTFPVGLVVGEQPIDVDLGTSGKSAGLYLDSEKVCSLSLSNVRCLVDLGEEPRVHLLELVQRNELGQVEARTHRWINRPGQEAELVTQFEYRSNEGVCGGRVMWFHPAKQDPVALEIEESGRPLLIGGDYRSFRFPCPDPREPQLVTASAIFPDGRRAESVAVSGGFGSQTEAGLTAIVLALDWQRPHSCQGIASVFGAQDGLADSAGFEVVFVVDPTAGYRSLMASGWSKLMRPSGSTVKVNPDYFKHQKGRGSFAEPKDSWKRAIRSLDDAEKMWIVLPDQELQRVNALSQGREAWLPMLFSFGSVKLEETPRIADAVAASGLVAAAGPRRRAVVLILGNKADQDGSQFTAEQARNYLAEVGVPLFVLRNAKLQDDGWPSGMPVKNMVAMAAALEAVKQALDRQCVVWIGGDIHTDQIIPMLPKGIRVAGRGDEGLGDLYTVWRSAGRDPGEIGGGSDLDEPASRAHLDVTAVSVLVAARDASGQAVADLDAGYLRVMEDGRPVPVLGLEPIVNLGAHAPEIRREDEDSPSRPPEQDESKALRVTIYVDRDFSGTADISPSLDHLADRADWLASLGEVDIVVADRELATVLESSRDVETIRSVLHDLAAKPAGQHAIERIRARFLRENGPMRDQGASRKPAGEGLLASARLAIYEEDHVVRRYLGQMSKWALVEPDVHPGVLFVVGAGFDEDPRDFYQPTIQRRAPDEAAAADVEYRSMGISRALWVNELGRELAAAGWMVVPVSGRTASMSGASFSAEQSGRGRLNEFMSDEGNAVGTTSPSWLLVDPIGSQRHLADPSGGEVVLGEKGLDNLVAESGGWYRLTYQVDRAPDGALHELEVTSTLDDTEIRATAVVVSGTSEGRSEVRLRHLLDGSISTGELPVELAVAEPQAREEMKTAAEITITVGFDPIAPLFVVGGTRILRFSVAVPGRDGEPSFYHRTGTAVGSMAGMEFVVPIQWSVAPRALAVVVEDLGSGVWGGAVEHFQD